MGGAVTSGGAVNEDEIGVRIFLTDRPMEVY